MKKFLVILAALLLLAMPFIISIASAQETPGLPEIPGNVTPEQIAQAQQKATTTWDYLSKEWQTILLKNKYIGFVDSILTKISFVFKILVGMDYSFSLTLFIAVVFWIFFFIVIGKMSSIFQSFSSFSPWVSRVIPLLLNIIFAQIGAFAKLAEFVIWFAFKDKAWWVSLIISILICGAIVLIVAVVSRFAKSMAAKRHKEKVELEETKLEGLVKAGKPIGKALEKNK